MIDYEKLKLAHDYLIKHEIKAKIIHGLLIDEEGNHKGYLSLTPLNKDTITFNCFYDLMKKLQELTQPEPKPKYKDAWFVSSHQTIECTKVENQEGYIYCSESHRDGFGRTMYPTREALIEAQIEYWKSLSAISDGYTPVICQHESDGHKYDKDLPAFDNNGVMIFRELFNKCNKCGEFYK